MSLGNRKQTAVGARLKPRRPYNPGRRNRNQGGAYVLVFPAMALFAVFVFFPIVWSIVLSLENYNLFSEQATFVGMHNYVTAITSGALYHSLVVTGYYVIGSVPLTIMLALLLAVLLNRKGLVAANVFQTIFFLPYIVSSVGATLVWKWMFDTNFGVINAFLAWFGVAPIAWLTTIRGAMPSIIIMSVWGGIGFSMVLFQAGLRSVPQELVEAARIDGATPWKAFWRITFPMLSPTTLFVVIISIINAAQVFTTVQVMTGGGPLGATNVIVFFIYQEAFQFFNLGYGSAIAIVLFVIMLALTAIMLATSRRLVYYEGALSDEKGA
jgi:ABC-type sugar transport system permease subunit